ncbi:MAG: hypothetical protein JKY08_07735 [Flavobacteriaceae bacterium]|nr:hypothetical protein [Flavobacteriaceae bacterium]
MADNKNTFSDFMTDKDGDYSTAQFLALAQKMLSEGRKPRKIFLSMYRAALTASAEHSIGEHYYLVKMIAVDASDYLPEINELVDEMLERLD